MSQLLNTEFIQIKWQSFFSKQTRHLLGSFIASGYKYIAS